MSSFPAGSVSGSLKFDLSSYFASLESGEDAAQAWDARVGDALANPLYGFSAAAQQSGNGVRAAMDSASQAAASAGASIGSLNASMGENASAAASDRGELQGLAAALSSAGESGDRLSAGGHAAADSTQHAAAAANEGAAATAGLGASMFEATIAIEAVNKVLELTVEGIRGVIEGFSEVGNAGADIANLSTKLGIPVEQLSRLKAVAQDVGVPFESVSTGLRLLERNAADAVETGGQAAQKWQDIGISTDFLKEHLGDAQAIFQALQTAMQGLPDPIERTRASMQLLGRGGSEIAPLLALSRDEMDRFGDTAKRLGAVEDDEAARSGKAWRAAEGQFTQAWEGIKRAAAEPILEFFSQYSEEVGQIVQDVSDVIRTAIPLAMDAIKVAIELTLPVIDALLYGLEAVAAVTDGLGLTSGAGSSAGTLKADLDRFSGEAFGGSSGEGRGTAVNIAEVNVGFDANDAADQVARKLQPHLKRALDEQTLAFKAHANGQTIAKAIGGRRA